MDLWTCWTPWKPPAAVSMASQPKKSSTKCAAANQSKTMLRKHRASATLMYDHTLHELPTQGLGATTQLVLGPLGAPCSTRRGCERASTGMHLRGLQRTTAEWNCGPHISTVLSLLVCLRTAARRLRTLLRCDLTSTNRHLSEPFRVVPSGKPWQL